MGFPSVPLNSRRPQLGLPSAGKEPLHRASLWCHVEPPSGGDRCFWWMASLVVKFARDRKHDPISPKWWWIVREMIFPYISGKFRLVKYYHFARSFCRLSSDQFEFVFFLLYMGDAHLPSYIKIYQGDYNKPLWIIRIPTSSFQKTCILSFHVKPVGGVYDQIHSVTPPKN